MPLLFLIVVGAVALAVAWGPLTRARAKADKLAECRELRRQLIHLRAQGGSTTEAAQLAAQLQLCATELQEMGVDDFTISNAAAVNCETMLEQIMQEWAHFKTTDYADIVKRGNTRGTILRLGAELNRCLENAANQATTAAELDALASVAKRHYEASVERARCYERGESGCSRYWGSLETDDKTKAREEIEQVQRGARDVYMKIRAARQARFGKASA